VNPAIKVVALMFLLLLCAVGPCDACAPRHALLSDSEQFAKASAVFLAHLTKAEESATHANMLEGTFRLIEVLKGQAPPDNKITTVVYWPGSCGLPLLVGGDYLFFLYEGEANSVRLGESRGPFDAGGYYEKKFLEQMRALRQ